MKFEIEMNIFAARGFVKKYGDDSKTHRTIADQLEAQLPKALEAGDVVNVTSKVNPDVYWHGRTLHSITVDTVELKLPHAAYDGVVCVQRFPRELYAVEHAS